MKEKKNVRKDTAVYAVDRFGTTLNMSGFPRTFTSAVKAQGTKVVRGQKAAGKAKRDAIR